MDLDKISVELQEMKINAMKRINMERNRTIGLFNEIEKEIENFKKRYEDNK